MKTSFIKSIFACIIAIFMAVTYAPEAYAADTDVTELSEITTYEEFIEALEVLEDLAFDYSVDNNIDDPAELAIKYIRTGVEEYNTGLWDNLAGSENTEFDTYVADYEAAVNAETEEENERLNVTGLKNISSFVLPGGDHADFGRMFGVIDLSYTNKDNSSYADAAGLLGQMADLLATADKHNVTGTIEQMVAVITEDFIMAAEDSADNTAITSALDGYYINCELISENYEKGLLTDIISTYFTEHLTNEQRAEYYLENRLQCDGSKESIRDAVCIAYNGNSLISKLEDMKDLNRTGEELEDLRTAVCYAAADYICRLAGDYVETVENTLFTVTSSEFSTLAPGITQEFKTAKLTDGRKLRYYIATADITRDDVNLYTNYYSRPVRKDDYGNYIWQLTPVLEQAQAAQERYGSPELVDPETGAVTANPDYIEGYNVIVSTNTDGFTMTGENAGEPGGLFVMNGEEVFPVDEDGFFGILKNGKAVIGTKEEYETVYKGQLAEAIGTFGAVLIENGKIVEDLNSTDFHSRTAVGITGSGKVVMMVLDGRQESSVGGAYLHLAQIMLEAGCVEAVNLDGGGSTTFVSRDPDTDELAVMNRPSDGYPRSVGPTMMVVSTADAAAAFDHAVLDSDTDYMTAGSEMQISAQGMTASGAHVDIPQEAAWEVSDTSIASVTEDGIITASKTGSVDVSLVLDGKTAGQKKIHVVVPDKIKFKKSYVDVDYNGKVTLPVKAYYEGRAVTVNPDDFEFAVSNKAAGSMEGFDFAAGDAGTKIRKTKVTAALKASDTVKAAIEVRFRDSGEIHFDFSSKTGGNRKIAWRREVDNATEKNRHIYCAVDTDKDMEVSYVFASDLTRFFDSEKSDDITVVKASFKVDENFDVDYSQLKVICDYFKLPEDGSGVGFDAETNTLTIRLERTSSDSPVDFESADSLCIAAGINLTPAKDAAWSAGMTLNAVNEGQISYEAAGSEYTYTGFSDSFTLMNTVKNGWQVEDGGYRYYENGEYYTGIHQISHRVNGVMKSLYYDFGSDGIIKGNVKGNIKKTAYTGLIENEDDTYSYSTYGVLTGGWVNIEEDWYYFDPDTKKSQAGEHAVQVTAQTQSSAMGDQTEIITETVTYEFDKTGKVMNGGTWFVNDEGKTYFYYGPGFLCRQWGEKDGKKVYFAMKGHLLRGIVRIREHSGVPGMYHMFDEETCEWIMKCEGFVKYKGYTYYYAPEADRVAGKYPEDSQVKDENADTLIYGRVKGFQEIDGKYYLFTKTYGAMQTGTRNVEHGIDGACTTLTFDKEKGYAVDKKGRARTDLYHVPVTDPAVKSTCTRMGLSEGSHCGECGEVLVAQHDTAVKSHTYSKTEYLQVPTVKKSGGYYRKCTVCGLKKWTKKLTYAKYMKDTVKKASVSLSTAYADRGIELKWKAPDVKVDGYRIYRSAAKNGPYKLVNTVKSSGRKWTDSGLKTGKRYYYKIRGYKTINGNKVYTKFSNKGYRYVLSGTDARTARAIDGSDTVKARKAVKVSKGIKVTWTKAAGSKCNRYEVWRAASKNGVYKKIATTSKTYYTDKSGSLKKQKRYYYKITGYRVFGKVTARTNKSNAVSAVR